MVHDKNPIILRPDNILEEPSFKTVLDTTCDRLWERQIQHSIRRIREMEEELKKLEKELDEFMERISHE